jgi:hypothetical protein
VKIRYLLLPFILLATANSAGYRYGASDQAFYAPAVMRQVDPALFPRDAPLLNTQAHLTLADETVGGAVRLTGADLPPVFAVLYALTLSLLAAAVALTGRTMFRERWTVVALLAAISLRHAIARSGTNTLEGYFHPRQLAFAFGALAICAFLRRRPVALVCALGAAAALHPTTTLWFAVWLYVALVVSEPRARRMLLLALAPMLPLAWWAFAAGPLAGRLTTMDAEWVAALADKSYIFPLQWPAHAWALNLGYVAVVIAAWRARQSSGTLVERETALVLGCVALVPLFAVALFFQWRGTALAIQLQPARVFWMLDFLATIYIVWFLAEWRGARRSVRAAFVAILLAAASAARGLYIMQVEFPDRPLAQIGIKDDDWGRTMAWAQLTDRSASWLANPLHAARYGTSVRVAAERDVFVEAIKDTALGMYDRDIAIRTRDRLADLGDFETLTAARARELGAAHQLDFLVTPAALDLPLAYQSGTLRVYRIGKPGGAIGNRESPTGRGRTGPVRAETGVARRAPDDGVRVGTPAPVPAAAARDGAAFRRGAEDAGARSLPLAAGSRGAAAAHRPARARRLEQRALHARARRQGVRRGLQRDPPEPAQLRRHRSAV